jgi:hypothetical protein
MVVCSEDLWDKTNATLNEIVAFLGLDEFDFSPDTLKGRYNALGKTGNDQVSPWNATAPTNPPMLSATRDRLRAFLQKHNEDLFRLIGKRCAWGGPGS